MNMDPEPLTNPEVLVYSNNEIAESDPEILYYIHDFVVPSVNNLISFNKISETNNEITSQPSTIIAPERKDSSPKKPSEDSNTFRNDFKPDNFYNSSDTEFTNSL
jgi:hypothetical protein